MLKDCLVFLARKFLRLAPIFYFVFFLGWAIFPYMGSGPVWYNSELIYNECKSTFWTQLLFISNMVPYYQPPNSGCFFWAWVVECDLQLALLIPLFVLAYNNSTLAGHFLVFFGVISN